MSTQTISTARTIERLETCPAYANPFMDVSFDAVVFPDGSRGRYSVVTAGTGRGVVVVPVARSRGIHYLGLVSQYRYPVKDFTLEFPRGGAEEADEQAAALRELREETGLVADGIKRLGSIQPDTGLLSTKISVWRTMHHVASPVSLHIEPETGCSLQWVAAGAFPGLIANGKITCGITLAAYAFLLADGIVDAI